MLLWRRQDGGTGLTVRTPLFLQDEHGGESQELRRIYFRDRGNDPMAGILYLVATPIGNLGDFSPRAVETLAQADFIAAEDTRVSVKLLNHFDIRKPLVSYHEHNRAAAGQAILERLLSGETCALVTDAGTPAISDPGQELVALCAANGVTVQAIPGCCAAISAGLCPGWTPGGLPSRASCPPGRRSAGRRWRS